MSSPSPARFIVQLAETPSPVQSSIQEISSLFGASLFHQVEVALLSLTRDPSAPSSLLASLPLPFLLPLFDKINPLSAGIILNNILKRVWEGEEGGGGRGEEEVRAALERVGEEGASAGSGSLHSLYGRVPQDLAKRDAALYLKGLLAEVLLRKGEIQQGKDLLRSVAPLLGPEAHTAVHARLHLSRAHLHKLLQQAPEFYAAGLEYLAHSDAGKELTPADRVLLAFDLALAALVGERVFNFGELIASPIFATLQQAPQQCWIAELLGAFSAGDVALCNTLVAKHAARMAEQPALVAARQQVAEKISVLALVDIAFRLPPGNRRLTFREIAAATSLELRDVEPLVMRTCSLGLLRATLDEVDQVVQIKWVKPRVLGPAEVQALRERLAGWGTKVEGTIALVEQATGTLAAQGLV